VVTLKNTLISYTTEIGILSMIFLAVGLILFIINIRRFSLRAALTPENNIFPMFFNMLASFLFLLKIFLINSSSS